MMLILGWRAAMRRGGADAFAAMGVLLLAFDPGGDDGVRVGVPFPG
jgi:hypothetical protein